MTDEIREEKITGKFGSSRSGATRASEQPPAVSSSDACEKIACRADPGSTCRLLLLGRKIK